MSFIRKFNKRNFSSLALVAVALALSIGPAYGASTDTTFDSVYTTLTDWTDGTLGRIIALALIVTGLGVGVVRQSIMAVVVGVSCGLALANASTVIEGIVGAVL